MSSLFVIGANSPVRSVGHRRACPSRRKIGEQQSLFCVHCRQFHTHDSKECIRSNFLKMHEAKGGCDDNLKSCSNCVERSTLFNVSAVDSFQNEGGRGYSAQNISHSDAQEMEIVDDEQLCSDTPRDPMVASRKTNKVSSRVQSRRAAFSSQLAKAFEVADSSALGAAANQDTLNKNVRDAQVPPTPLSCGTSMIADGDDAADNVLLLSPLKDVKKSHLVTMLLPSHLSRNYCVSHLLPSRPCCLAHRLVPKSMTATRVRKFMPLYVKKSPLMTPLLSSPLS